MNESHEIYILSPEAAIFPCRSNKEVKVKCYYNINNKLKYILYRTLIVNKDYRKKGIATKIEISINRYLEKIQKNAFLITKKKTINFHKKHGWLPIKKSNFQIIDHKNTLHGMIRPKMKNIMSKKFTLYYDK